MHWKQPGAPGKRILLVTLLVLILMVVLAVALHRGSHASVPDATALPQDNLPTLMPASPSATIASPTTAPSITPAALSTPSLSLDDIQKLTLTPQVSSTTLKIYQKGQALGNDPHAFSKVGDCNSLDPYFLSYFDLDPSAYSLDNYAFLQPAIDQFKGSFTRKSLAVGDGFNTSAVLSPAWADPNVCSSNESPLACEYRVNKPTFAIIAIGTDDYLTPARYEANMRTILDTTINLGIVPILATKMDNANQLNYNPIITKLALEYDIPLADLAQAMQSLPQKGLLDNIHPTGATVAFDFNSNDLTHYGWPVRNLTILQALYGTWRGVTQP
jgi:hypothetical protein